MKNSKIGVWVEQVAEMSVWTLFQKMINIGKQFAKMRVRVVIKSHVLEI